MIIVLSSGFKMVQEGSKVFKGVLKDSTAFYWVLQGSRGPRRFYKVPTDSIGF